MVLRIARGRILAFMKPVRKLYKDQLVQECRNQMDNSQYDWQKAKDVPFHCTFLISEEPIRFKMGDPVDSQRKFN